MDLYPRELHIELTYQCNSRCVMCDLWTQGLRSGDKELGVKEIECLVRESGYLKDIETVVISGGEPFLRKDLIRILQVLIDRFPKATFNILTNAVETDFILESLYKIIKTARPYRLCIGSSLDGIDKAHDRIRGMEGSYERTVKTMGYIKKIVDIECFFNFTITPENYSQLIPAYNLSKKMDIQFSAQFAVDKKGYYKAHWSEAQLLEIQEMIEHSIMPDLLNNRGYLNGHEAVRQDVGLSVQLLYWRQIVSYQRQPRRILQACCAGSRFVMLDPFGNVYFCPLLKDKTIGNIRDASFDKIWESDRADMIRSGIKQGRCHCWLVCVVAPVAGEALAREEGFLCAR